MSANVSYHLHVLDIKLLYIDPQKRSGELDQGNNGTTWPSPMVYGMRKKCMCAF